MEEVEKKECNCGPDCKCGCQEGKPCTCGDKGCKCGDKCSCGCGGKCHCKSGGGFFPRPPGHRSAGWRIHS